MFNDVFFISFCLTLFMVCSGALATDCDKYNHLLYKETGCKPNTIEGQVCPVSYDCESVTHVESSCCGDLDVTCQETVCTPEPLPEGKSCYYTGELSDCCYDEVICENNVPKEITCRVNNKTYKDKEHFIPDNSCQRCICSGDFKDELAPPHCRMLRCSLQFTSSYQDKCAPVYRDSGAERCCPISWLCQDESMEEPVAPRVEFRKKTSDASGNCLVPFREFIEACFEGHSDEESEIRYKARKKDISDDYEIIKLNSYAWASDDLSCQFGEMVIELGEGFRKPGLECECIVPPLLTCTLKTEAKILLDEDEESE